jgi:hypothetical protein
MHCHQADCHRKNVSKWRNNFRQTTSMMSKENARATKGDHHD